MLKIILKRIIKISFYIFIIVLFLTLLRYNSGVFLASHWFNFDGPTVTKNDYLVLGNNFYILNPYVLLSPGGIVFLLTFISSVILLVFKLKKNFNYPTLFFIFGIIIAPLFLIYNPLVVPLMVKTTTWVLPRRINYYPNLLVFLAILFSFISVIIAAFFEKIKLFQGKKQILTIMPFIFVIFLIMLLMGIKDLREGVLVAINAKKDYLNVADIPNNDLFRYLNTEIPGGSIICSDPNTSYLIGAYTNHYVASFHLTRMGVSYEEAARRASDSERIMGLSLSPEDLIKTLDEYRCNYIVFNKKNRSPDEIKKYQSVIENIFESSDYFVIKKRI